MADTVQLQQRAGDAGVHGEQLDPNAWAEEEGWQIGRIVNMRKILSVTITLTRL